MNESTCDGGTRKDEEFTREPRYAVLKIKDIRHLPSRMKSDLHEAACHINTIRKLQMKSELRCVVVEDDWPEYEVVWALLEARCNPTKENIDKVADLHAKHFAELKLREK